MPKGLDVSQKVRPFIVFFLFYNICLQNINDNSALKVSYHITSNLGVI